MLVNIDLMVRVIVADDATEDEMCVAAVDKCIEYSKDRSFFGENISEIEEDFECEYGTMYSDIPKKE